MAVFPPVVRPDGPPVGFTPTAVTQAERDAHVSPSPGEMLVVSNPGVVTVPPTEALNPESQVFGIPAGASSAVPTASFTPPTNYDWMTVQTAVRTRADGFQYRIGGLMVPIVSQLLITDANARPISKGLLIIVGDNLGAGFFTTGDLLYSVDTSGLYTADWVVLA